ncbi:MAG TPA: winged helix-turn-helix domain-containing protein, partial [Candidatus Dormibacteraeota bacterium]|nr:winged helix-turn-helix domain-containing protein [Candidatus Dormibacteraeota bacterium]
ASHEITLRGQKLNLTPTEETLFYLLVRYAGKVVTCRHLLRSVWGSDSENRIHDLRVYVAQLRKKLGDYGELIIRSEGSIGYCLALSPRQENSRVATMSEVSS